jgi:hypothetical protein
LRPRSDVTVLAILIAPPAPEQAAHAAQTT